MEIELLTDKDVPAPTTITDDSSAEDVFANVKAMIKQLGDNYYDPELKESLKAAVKGEDRKR